MKIQREEGCIESTEKTKDSMEDLLHDPFYWDLFQGLDVREMN